MSFSHSLWHPFTQEQTARSPLKIKQGKGAVLWDDQGKEYLDLISSWWVNLHGHCHPKIAQAIAKQAEQLEHVLFSGITHEPAEKLAALLCKRLPSSLSRVFFSDNGSTSVEIALKICYQYWHNQGERKRRRFLAFQGGYHGDTWGAMSVGRSSGFYSPFDSQLLPTDFIPFPDTWNGDESCLDRERTALKWLTSYLERHSDEVIAFIGEPLIQGAGGFRFCRIEFLQRCMEILHSYGILTIFDEVMTGFGRTGEWFACTKSQTTPNLICLSKGITGGFLPLGATVVQEKIYEAFLDNSFSRAFAHGHSYTANPLGCAASLASLALFEEEESFKKIRRIETIHLKWLSQLASVLPCIEKPRVMGAIAAWNLKQLPSEYASSLFPFLQKQFLDQGLLLRPLGNVIYLIPPYCIEEAQLNSAYEKIATVLSHLDVCVDCSGFEKLKF